MDLMPYFMSRLEHVSRLDIVRDQYFSNSLKEYTRKVRGEGTRRRVLENTAIPKNWAGFLRNSDNKKELFCFLAEKISKLNSGSKEVYTTHLNDVLTAHEYDDSINEIKPCNHEEADTRMFLHVAHAAKHGHQKVSIRTVDTDVVVLAVAQIQHLQISELWIEFGIGKHYRFIPAHLVALSMGPERASALPFFHALTGCDTTSAFCGIGKKTAWDAWEIFPQVITVFSSLSKNLCEIDHSLLDKLEHFVVLLYSKTCEAERVNEARQELFARGRSVENIPPTQGALIQYVYRAAFQAGYIWGQALVPQQQLPSPSNWGWEETQDGWMAKWTTLPEASTVCNELLRCGCKKSCQGLCKCFRAKLKCTFLCACAGHCSRQEP